MAALLVVLAGMSLMLSMALPVWHHAAQREREAELIFRGEQYARAIMLYQRRTPGAYPPAVEGRFLRRAYRDPMTAGGEFRLILQSELAEFSGLGAVGGAADDGEPTEARDGPRRQRQGEDVRDRPGFMQGVRSFTNRGERTPGGVDGNIAGVVSRSEETSIALYNGQSRYSDWVFLRGRQDQSSSAYVSTLERGSGIWQLSPPDYKGVSREERRARSTVPADVGALLDRWLPALQACASAQGSAEAPPPRACPSGRVDTPASASVRSRTSSSDRFATSILIEYGPLVIARSTIVRSRCVWRISRCSGRHGANSPTSSWRGVARGASTRAACGCRSLRPCRIDSSTAGPSPATCSDRRSCAALDLQLLLRPPAFLQQGGDGGCPIGVGRRTTIGIVRGTVLRNSPHLVRRLERRAELRGHNRTWSGAQPPSCANSFGVKNRRCWYWQLDKMERTARSAGDPESALLEILTR